MKKVFKLPYLPVIAAPLVLFFPLLFRGHALFWGTPSLQFVPWWDWAWDTLRMGYIPLWNPLVGMGAPLIANYQSALFYPPHWVYFLLHLAGGAALMAWGQALMIAAHLIWSGLGMVYLTRRLGGDDLAQAVSGLAFSLSGYLVARAGFLSINAASAWLPWILYLSLVLVQDQDLKSVLKLVLAMAFQLLAGHAQTTYYTLLLSGVWVIFWTWKTAKQRKIKSHIKRVLVTMGKFALSGVTAGLLAAVQLLPTFEYLIESQRTSAVDYEFAMTYSFWPWRFLTLIAPDLFGNPVQGNYWGYANYWEDAIYIGLLPFLLAAGWAIKSVRSVIGKTKFKSRHTGIMDSELSLFLLLVIVLSFLWALGSNTPIFPWFYEHIPTFDLFQAPTRFTLWAVFALSLMAGMGVMCWKRPRGRGLYWTRLATAGAFAITLGAGLSWLYFDAVKMTFIRATALAGIWGAGAGVLSLLAPEGQQRTKRELAWKTGVVIWIALDLIVAGWGLNPGIHRDFYRKIEPSSPRKERLFMPADVEYEVKFREFFRFETFRPGKGWKDLRRSSLPNLNMLDRLSMVNNFDPLLPERYQIWMGSIKTIQPKKESMVYEIMGIGSVAVHDGNGQVHYRQLQDGGELIRWIPCGKPVSSPQEALDSVLESTVDLNKYVVLEAKDPGYNSECLHSKGTLSVDHTSPNMESYNLVAESPGWVLRSVVWYPGWRAYVDGKQVPLYRGDYLFQAVRVPSGAHHLVFEYRPVSIKLGAALTGITLLGLGAVFIRFRGEKDGEE